MQSILKLVERRALRGCSEGESVRVVDARLRANVVESCDNGYLYLLILQFVHQLSLNLLHLLIFQLLLLAGQNKPLFLTSIWLGNDMEMYMVDHLTAQNIVINLVCFLMIMV